VGEVLDVSQINNINEVDERVTGTPVLKNEHPCE
jgi:hypothetical protein